MLKMQGSGGERTEEWNSDCFVRTWHGRSPTTAAHCAITAFAQAPISAPVVSFWKICPVWSPPIIIQASSAIAMILFQLQDFFKHPPTPSRIISSCERDDILLKPQKNQNTWKWYVIKGSNQRNLSRRGDILIERFTSSFIIVIKANFNSNNVKLLSQTPPGVFSLKLECRLQWEVKFHLSPRRATVCLLSITSAGR